MEYLAIQMSVLLGGAIVVGGLVGWWVARFIYHQAATACRIELAGLRRNYEDSARENVNVRNTIRQLEGVLRKIGTPPSDTEYGQFLQVRKTLEKTRLQYQSLLDKCHQQQQVLGNLTAELQGNKQELAALQAAMSQQQGVITTSSSVPLREDTFSAANRDDLTRIQGINQRVASKLQALGIVTYRQVAEFTSDDLYSIQRVLGAELSSVPEGWVQSAHSLFQQQSPPLQA